MAFPVDWEDLIPNDFQARSRSLHSRGGDVYVVAHHAVARTVGQIIATFKSAARTVSAQWAIGPINAGVDNYKVVRTVQEWNRAYTTAASIDDRAVTFEMANLVLAPPWPVGQTGKNIVVAIIVYMHREYGMPIDRYHVTCHREVYQRGWGSYATACPGDDLHASLDWCVAEARRQVAGPPPKTPEELEEEELMAAKDDINRHTTGEANRVLSGVRRDSRHRIFEDTAGRVAAGKVGSVVLMPGRNLDERRYYMQLFAEKNPLTVPKEELDSFVARVTPVYSPVAFYRQVDTFLAGFESVKELGEFEENRFELTGGDTLHVRSNGVYSYPSRQDVWADARPVRIMYEGTTVKDFVNDGGTYKAVLEDGETVTLTETEVARANAQRPSGQDWAVNP